MKCISGKVQTEESLSESQIKSMDSFADVSVVVEAHFEERLMDLREVLAMRPGTVISLNRPAGETLLVFVGNVLLASAEVIVIEDHLALRITEFKSRL